MGVFINRTGEFNINNQGLKMTIIKYKDAHNVDVQFEDGIIVEHKDYKSFKLKQIKHPSYARASFLTDHFASKHLGEETIATNGQKMKIIAIRNAKDIDVKFEDGYIAYNKEYRHFKKGNIANYNYNKNNKIGKTIIATCGMKMKIINYRNSSDIDVQFEDGSIVEHKTYSCFKLGNILNPNSKKYMTENIAKNGQKIKIINFKNYNHIDVEFEDGTIVYDKTYQNFKIGKIKNPNFDKTKKYYIEKISAIGLKMKVISYRNGKDIDVQFEDGTIVEHKSFSAFKRGFIYHPSFIFGQAMSDNYFGYKIKKIADINNKIYYEAYKNDEFIALMTLQEIYQMGSEINEKKK